MNRITRPLPGGGFAADDLEAAVQRLGMFESMAEELAAEQTALSAELACLRERGQTRSYRFREKMAQKLANTAAIDRLSRWGLL